MTTKNDFLFAARKGGAAMTRTFAMLLALAASPACAFDIHNDRGGSVAVRIAEVERLRVAGTEVRIVGICQSACTLYLGLPNACVTSEARLGFHGPQTRMPGLPLPRATFETVSLQMASYYPGGIRGWFLRDARMQSDLKTITGAEAVRHGAKECR